MSTNLSFYVIKPVNLHLHWLSTLILWPLGNLIGPLGFYFPIASITTLDQDYSLSNIKS